MAHSDEDRTLQAMDKSNVDRVRRLVKFIEKHEEPNGSAAHGLRAELRKTLEDRKHIPSWGPLPVDLQERAEQAASNGTGGGDA